MERVHVSYGHFADARVDVDDRSIRNVIDALTEILKRGVPEHAVVSFDRRFDGESVVQARWGGKPGDLPIVKN